VSNAELIFSPFCVFPELPLFGRSVGDAMPRRRSFSFTHCASGYKQARGGGAGIGLRVYKAARRQVKGRSHRRGRRRRGRFGHGRRGQPQRCARKEKCELHAQPGFFCVRPALFASRARPNALSPTPPLPAQPLRCRPGDHGRVRPVGCAPACALPPPSEAGWINVYKRLQTERYFRHPPNFSDRL